MFNTNKKIQNIEDRLKDIERANFKFNETLYDMIKREVKKEVSRQSFNDNRDLIDNIDNVIDCKISKQLLWSVEELKANRRDYNIASIKNKLELLINNLEQILSREVKCDYKIFDTCNVGININSSVNYGINYRYLITKEELKEKTIEELSYKIIRKMLDIANKFKYN